MARPRPLRDHGRQVRETSMRQRWLGRAAPGLIAGIVMVGVMGGTAIAQEKGKDEAPLPAPPEGEKLPPLPAGRDLDTDTIRFVPPKWHVGQRWEQRGVVADAAAAAAEL